MRQHKKAKQPLRGGEKREQALRYYRQAQREAFWAQFVPVFARWRGNELNTDRRRRCLG